MSTEKCQHIIVIFGPKSECATMNFYRNYVNFLVISMTLLTVQGLPQIGGRIVGGTPVDISNHPYMASYEYLDSHHCGASIVSEYWVVTAAHCTDTADEVDYITIRAGTTIRESDGYVHKATRIVTHPKFDYLTYDYDVALIEVATPFVYGASVKPISIASEEPSAGLSAIIVGWGSTYSGGAYSDLLLQATVQISDRKQCTDAYASGDFGDITETMICAGVAEGGKDTCQGDSGGPLLMNGNIVGIVSWGVGCGVRGYPGIYTNLAIFKDFVNNTISTKTK